MCDFRQFVFQATVGTLWSIQNQFDFVAVVASIPRVDQNKKNDITLTLKTYWTKVTGENNRA